MVEGIKQPTKEQIDEFDRTMKDREPERQKRDQKLKEDQETASETQKMLETRTRTQSVFLSLDGGGKIEVFSRLSRADANRCDVYRREKSRYMLEAQICQQKLVALDLSKDGADIESKKLEEELQRNLSRAEESHLKIIAIITADPAITFEWLRDNPDKYSASDILEVYMAYQESQNLIRKEQYERVMKAISFLKDETGAGVRSVPALDEDQGSEGMGGSP